MEKEKFDFEAFVKLAGEQLRSGKPLTGSEGVFTPLLKKVLEASLEGELDQHLAETRKDNKNRRMATHKKISQGLWGASIFFRPATATPVSSPRL